MEFDGKKLSEQKSILSAGCGYRFSAFIALHFSSLLVVNAREHDGKVNERRMRISGAYRAQRYAAAR